MLDLLKDFDNPSWCRSGPCTGFNRTSSSKIWFRNMQSQSSIYIYIHKCRFKHMLSVYRYNISYMNTLNSTSNTHKKRAWKSIPPFSSSTFFQQPRTARWTGAIFGELRQVNFGGQLGKTEITNQKCNQRINQLSIQIYTHIYILYTYIYVLSMYVYI